MIFYRRCKNRQCLNCCGSQRHRDVCELWSPMGALQVFPATPPSLKKIRLDIQRILRSPIKAVPSVCAVSVARMS